MGGAVFKELADQMKTCIVRKMGCGLLLTSFTAEELGMSAPITRSIATSTYMIDASLNDSG